MTVSGAEPTGGLYKPIVGQPEDVKFHFEVATTKKEVADLYESYMRDIDEVFSKIEPSPIGDPNYTFTPEDYDQLEKAYNGLLDLATNGMEIDGKVYYLNTGMADGLNMVFASFESAGLFIPPADHELSDAEKTKSVIDWASKGQALGEIIDFAVGVAITWKSITAMIYTDYIAHGNEMLAGTLEELQKALELTQQAIQILTTMQTLYGKKASSTPDKFPLPVGETDPEAYLKKLIDNGDAYVENGVVIYTTINQGDIDEFAQMQKELESLIKSLNESSGFTKTPLTDNEGYEGSLSQKLQEVLDDTYEAKSLNNWILDGMNDPNNTNKGDYGRALDTAVVAAQTLNTEHTEDVREALYVYEEFVKSANSILQTLQQILERIAKGIAGGG
jgi:hypothetical protein